jgi:tetratricopeptide (TPR) repeat protein
VGAAVLETLFAVAHHHLPRRARKLLWLIGLHPSCDPETPSLAAMADLPLDRTVEALDQLTAARLIDPSPSGGWLVHDLVRAQAAALDPPEDPDAAFSRLLEWYLAATVRATEAAYGTHPDTTEVGTSTPLPSFDDGDAAIGWLETRQDCLYEAVLCAPEHGAQRPAAYLAAALFRYFSVRGHLDEWTDISIVAVDAARLAEDRRVEGRLWLNLGYAYSDSSRHAEAEDCFQNSLTISQGLLDKRAQATVLNVLAGSNMIAGRFRQSYEYASVALPMSREIGDPVGEAIALEHLGIVDTLRGEYSQAIWLIERSLAIYNEHDVHAIIPDAHCELALPHMRQSEYDVAERHLDEALDGFSSLGDHSAAGWSRSRLGLVKSLRGEHSEAMEEQQRALHEMRRSPKHNYRAEALNNAGVTYRLAGRPAKALDHHRLAAESAERAECPYESARAVQGMGLVHRDSGSDHLADRYLSDARTRFMMLGAAEAHPPMAT